MTKYLLSLSILLTLSKASFSQTSTPAKQYTISLPKESWITVIRGLGELKASETFEIIQFIQQNIYYQDAQAQKQASDTTTKKQPLQTEKKKP